jgi:hypothetical protein
MRQQWREVLQEGGLRLASKDWIDLGQLGPFRLDASLAGRALAKRASG